MLSGVLVLNKFVGERKFEVLWPFSDLVCGNAGVTIIPSTSFCFCSGNPFQPYVVLQNTKKQKQKGKFLISFLNSLKMKNSLCFSTSK